MAPRPPRLPEFAPGFLAAVSPVVSVVSSGDVTSRTEYINPRATLMNPLGRHARGDASVVFATEMVAFFEMAGLVTPSAQPTPDEAPPRPFFGFRRTAFGLIRVGTDGERLLVFSDTGMGDVKEAYAYDVLPGRTAPTVVVAPALTARGSHDEPCQQRPGLARFGGAGLRLRAALIGGIDPRVDLPAGPGEQSAQARARSEQSIGRFAASRPGFPWSG